MLLIIGTIHVAQCVRGFQLASNIVNEMDRAAIRKEEMRLKELARRQKEAEKTMREEED